MQELLKLRAKLRDASQIIKKIWDFKGEKYNKNGNYDKEKWSMVAMEWWEKDKLLLLLLLSLERKKKKTCNLWCDALSVLIDIY